MMYVLEIGFRNCLADDDKHHVNLVKIFLYREKISIVPIRKNICVIK